MMDSLIDQIGTHYPLLLVAGAAIYWFIELSDKRSKYILDRNEREIDRKSDRIGKLEDDMDRIDRSIRALLDENHRVRNLVQRLISQISRLEPPIVPCVTEEELRQRVDGFDFTTRSA